MSSGTLSNTSLFYFPIIASNTVDISEIQHTSHQEAKLRKKKTTRKVNKTDEQRKKGRVEELWVVCGLIC